MNSSQSWKEKKQRWTAIFFEAVIGEGEGYQTIIPEFYVSGGFLPAGALCIMVSFFVKLAQRRPV